MTKPYKLRVNNKIVKEFDTRQDIDDYVSQNYNDAAWHQGYLPEVEVTGQYKKPSTSFSNMLSNSVNRFKKEAASAMTLDWGNRVSNAQKHPDAMNAVQSGGNIAGGMIAGAAGLTTAPYMYNALKSIAPYLSANGWLQSTTAVGNTPAWLTPTTATAIDATLAGSTTAGAINDMRQNGPSVGNVVGTTFGLGGLAFEAAPLATELYQKGKRAYDIYQLGKNMNTAVKTAEMHPSLRSFITDFNFGKGSGLVVRADKGDGLGAFTGTGAYIKNGFLYPGKARMEGQRDFTWWNENELFSPGFKTKPFSRVFIANKSDIPGLQRVRDMNEPVGQWRPGSKKAFVRKSEMVTPEPIDVTKLTQYNYNPDLGVYVRSDIPNKTIQMDSPSSKYSFNLRSKNLKKPSIVRKAEPTVINDLDFTKIEDVYANKNNIHRYKQLYPNAIDVKFGAELSPQHHPIIQSAMPENELWSSIDYFNDVVKPLAKKRGYSLSLPSKKPVYYREIPAWMDIDGYATKVKPNENNLGGWYNDLDGTSFINIKFPDRQSATVHEYVSHGTDQQLRDAGENAYKLFITKLKDQSNPQILHPDSNRPEEARATINELRNQLYKEGKITTNNGSVDISNVSDSDLDRLFGLNGYSDDYKNLYDNLTPDKQADFKKYLRFLLSSVPASAAVINMNESK